MRTTVHCTVCVHSQWENAVPPTPFCFFLSNCRSYTRALNWPAQIDDISAIGDYEWIVDGVCSEFASQLSKIVFQCRTLAGILNVGAIYMRKAQLTRSGPRPFIDYYIEIGGGGGGRSAPFCVCVNEPKKKGARSARVLIARPKPCTVVLAYFSSTWLSWLSVHTGISIGLYLEQLLKDCCIKELLLPNKRRWRETWQDRLNPSRPHTPPYLWHPNPATVQ